MSSYTKQLIEQAAVWLRVNPDPKDPFIRAPSVLADVEHALRLDTTTETELAKYEPLLKDKRLPDHVIAELTTSINRLREIGEDVKTTKQELLDAQKRLDNALNGVPTVGHAKSTACTTDHLETILGRWILAWARDGYNVFDLSPDFVAAMLLTNPTEIAFDELKLPFRGLLFTIPTGFAVGAEGRAYTKIHVSEISAADALILKAANKISDAIKDLPRDKQHSILSQAAERPAILEQARTEFVEKGVDVAPAIHISASDGVHILDTLIEADNLSWKTFEALPDGVTEEQDVEARRALCQIVFGTLAYIVAVRDAAIERVEPTKKKTKKPSTEQRAKFWDVGRTIRIAPELIRAARSGAREVAFRLKHQHAVMGHYRNQAHGPGMKDRKRIWIAPYWKGPEEGAKLIHTYKPEQRA